MLKDLTATQKEINAWESYQRENPLDKLFVKFEVDPQKIYCEECGWEIYPSQRWIQIGETKRFKQCVNQHGLATYHKTCSELKEAKEKKKKMRLKRRKHAYYLRVRKPATLKKKRYWRISSCIIDSVLKIKFEKKREAVDYAKYLLSNHPKIKWKNVYRVYKEPGK